MTYGILRRSVGERWLLEYMRLCDLVIFLGFGSTAAGGFVWHSVRVMGFGFGFIAVGATVKLAGVIIAYLLMSSRRPTSEIPIWIRRWTRTSSGFGALTALYVLVAHSNVGVQIAAGFAALLCALLFMRVDAVTRGEWDMGAGPSWDEMAFPIARWGPAWGWELNIWLTGTCLAGAIVLRTVMPSAFEPRIADPNELKIRLFAVVQAERRYYVAHRSYASDIWRAATARFHSHRFPRLHHGRGAGVSSRRARSARTCQLRRLGRRDDGASDRRHEAGGTNVLGG